jgi:hypothetical protein
VSVKSPRCIESHPKLSDLNLSAVVQQSLVDEHPIEIGAIERAHVFDFKRCAVANKFCVPSRHGHVVEKNICFRVSTGHCGILVEQKTSPSVGALSDNQSAEAGGKSRDNFLLFERNTRFQALQLLLEVRTKLLCWVWMLEFSEPLGVSLITLPH